MKKQKNPAAVALGKLGGSATSKQKANAARRNAKLGGWPKGKKRGPRKLDANANAFRIVREAEKLTQQAQAPRPPED